MHGAAATRPAATCSFSVAHHRKMSLRYQLYVDGYLALAAHTEDTEPRVPCCVFLPFFVDIGHVVDAVCCTNVAPTCVVVIVDAVAPCCVVSTVIMTVANTVAATATGSGS